MQRVLPFREEPGRGLVFEADDVDRRALSKFHLPVEKRFNDVVDAEYSSFYP